MKASKLFSYTNKSQEHFSNNYQSLLRGMSLNGLRIALKRHCQSPEAYFYLRYRMAASHGVQSTADWILGVGDRHLSNALVLTKTGDYIFIHWLGSMILLVNSITSCFKVLIHRAVVHCHALGDIIGIDFGMAFGSATSKLPIPELVPCRLTPQFQNLIPGLALNGRCNRSPNY